MGSERGLKGGLDGFQMGSDGVQRRFIRRSEGVQMGIRGVRWGSEGGQKGKHLICRHIYRRLRSRAHQICRDHRVLGA